MNFQEMNSNKAEMIQRTFSQERQFHHAAHELSKNRLQYDLIRKIRNIKLKRKLNFLLEARAQLWKKLLSKEL